MMELKSPAEEFYGRDFAALARSMRCLEYLSCAWLIVQPALLYVFCRGLWLLLFPWSLVVAARVFDEANRRIQRSTDEGTVVGVEDFFRKLPVRVVRANANVDHAWWADDSESRVETSGVCEQVASSDVDADLSVAPVVEGSDSEIEGEMEESEWVFA